jgi:EmrB/QacA subfamily drug resistance transporter
VAELLQRSSARGRRTLATVTLGSGIALLDGTVVNIAVRSIGTDLHAGLASLQWVVNGYFLSLASLILVGGAAGDRFGRRRVYAVGVAGFAMASALCAFAGSPGQLIAFRVVQGVFAALLTPGSLAIIQSSFRPADRASAIGTWAGVSGIATAVGPFVGGLLVEHAGWRWIFAINVPLCALVLWLVRDVPESRDEEGGGRFDVLGGMVGVAVLGVLTYTLTAWRSLPGSATAALAVLTGLGALAFVLLQRRPDAMVPLDLFASRVFTAANLMTLLVYGALGALMFLLVLQLQVSAGYGALGAGLATLPVTVVMLLLSSRAAVVAERTGPRLPMTVGPLVCSVGVLLLAFVDGGSSYWLEVFPGMLVFALGLTSLVSPLTTAVLAAAPDRHAGIASGINNAVARSGSLLAVAALPAAVGLTGAEYRDPTLLTAGYREAILVCAALLALGGAVSWFGLAGTTGQTEGQEVT